MFRKFSLPLDKLDKSMIYEIEGKKYININIFDKREQNQFGKDLDVKLDIPKKNYEKGNSEQTKLCEGKFVFTRAEKELLANGANPKDFGGHDVKTTSIDQRYSQTASVKVESNNEQHNNESDDDERPNYDDLPF